MLVGEVKKRRCEADRNEKPFDDRSDEVGHRYAKSFPVVIAAGRGPEEAFGHRDEQQQPECHKQNDHDRGPCPTCSEVYLRHSQF
jgi:hypothetical protein